MTDLRATTSAGQNSKRMHAMAMPEVPHWTAETAVRVPRRRRDIREHALDGEAVLFDPATGNTYQLNRTARTVWRRCDGRADARQIAEKQVEDYDVDFEAALDHVEQLVTQFAESGLLETGSDS